MAKRVKISFLGGVGEIGKNMTVLEYGEDIIVVDAGLTFPNMEETPGIEYIIPDYSYLLSNKNKVRGVFVTHGHEDHIGALPFFLKDFDVPVYGSPLALGILESKLKERKINAQLVEVDDRDVVEAGKLKVEFIRVTHSIAGSFALSIGTPKGVIFMTGDFKIDHTPIDGKRIDLHRISEIGTDGVLLLMMDSTNVERPGYSMSERNVYMALENQFVTNTDKRIVVATFASNVHRIQQIINCAIKYKRKVVLCGRSVQKIVDIGMRLGEILCPEGVIIDMKQIDKYDYDELCIICTGTQGEPSSALTRMSNDDFSNIEIGGEDVVLLSASAIPGNERTIFQVINSLSKKGADVVYQALAEIHSSGHAYKEELKMMFALLHPKYFIPVHGEYRHLKLHKELALSMGIGYNHVLLVENGNSVEVDEDSIRYGCNVPYGSTLFDGNYLVEDVNGLIQDRKALGSEGCVMCVVHIDPNTEIEPIITTRGVNITDEVRASLIEEIQKDVSSGKLAEMGMESGKQYIRKFLLKKLCRQIDKRPVIMPVLI